MANPASAKKQIVESIKEVTNVLVTVSKDPSVDELSAALGLTIFLNKLGKHATAVASGEMPHAIKFLEPNKTFEDSADSLRDFIIALNKEKADHLSYKVEGDIVKISITPYRTTISKDDLEFSQGDYNVETVIALNVASHDDLDAALSAHGKIMHDATVATIAANRNKSTLGAIDWSDDRASSVSEMVAGIIDDLKTPKAAPDEQIATALLTGIVSATDRFSNDLTSSRVMTVAAELMAAGANQQLIVARLDEAREAEVAEEANDQNSDGSTTLKEGASTKIVDNSERSSKGKKGKKPNKPKKDDGRIGVMKIDHSREGDIDDVARQVMEESQEDAARTAEAKLDRHLGEVGQTQEEVVQDVPAEVDEPEVPQAPEPAVAAPTNIMEDLQQATEEASQPVESATPEPVESDAPVIGEVVTPSEPGQINPLVGGTLNATAAQAAEDKRREAENSRNRTILTHGKPVGDSQPTLQTPPLNASMSTHSDEPASVDVFATPPSAQPPQTQDFEPVAEQQQPADTASLLAEALNTADAAPANADAVPDIENIPAPTPVEPIGPVIEPLSSQGAPAYEAPDANMAPAPMQEQPVDATPGMPPMPAFPAMPDFSNLPPLPPAPEGAEVGGIPPIQPLESQPQPPQDFNPSQFQIPNQPQ